MNITPAEYEDLGFLPGQDEEELMRAIRRAELLLDNITGGSITACDSLSDLKKHALKKAICAQAEFFLETGFTQENQGQTIKVGDFSYTLPKQHGNLPLNPFAMALLKLNGLYQIQTEVMG